MERYCFGCSYADEGVACGKAWSKTCRETIKKYEAERDAIRAKIKIRTEHVYPPIPVREWDWSAVDDNTYEPGCPIGWGRTEKAAIENLIDEIQLNT